MITVQNKTYFKTLLSDFGQTGSYFKEEYETADAVS